MVDINLMGEKIKNNLSLVPGIKEAFDYEPQSMSQLPAATLFFDSFTQSDGTTRRKEVDWLWTVRLYIPLNTSDIKIPQLQLRTLIQNTMQQLREDLDLGGTCLYHNVTNGEAFALLEQNNPMMVAELTLTATTEEDY